MRYLLPFLLLPSLAMAQQQQPATSPASQLAGQFASAYAEAENHIAALQAQVADLQKQLAAAKAESAAK